ncbi:MAG TPA: hypothetical protein VHB01_05855 [Nitrosospira sp.]|jgi:hypothetical protein|nr:hypothetical protein [Nitrosospira sp.]
MREMEEEADGKVGLGQRFTPMPVDGFSRNAIRATDEATSASG